MKSLPLFAVVLAVLAFAAPQSHASVGKLAGKFTGSGTLVDKSNPAIVYTYTFGDIIAAVAKTGRIKGSTMVTAKSTSNGVTTRYPGGTPMKITGTVLSATIEGGKLTAIGELKFSNGSTIDGMISVSATTGKGTLKAKASTGPLSVNFLLRKSK